MQPLTNYEKKNNVKCTTVSFLVDPDKPTYFEQI